MKKTMMLIAVLAMVGSNSAFAQSYNSKNDMGRGSAASTNTGSSNGYMNWVVGIGSLALLGTVVGLSASSAASSPSSFGH